MFEYKKWGETYMLTYQKLYYDFYDQPGYVWEEYETSYIAIVNNKSRF